MRIVAICLFVAAVAHAGSPPDLWTRKAGGDWPRFLGPTGDGVSPETGILTTWPKGGLEGPLGGPDGPGVRTRRPSAGDGCSTSTASATTTGSPAANAETGQLLWKFEYPTDYDDLYGYSPGPRAGPVVDGDRVYIHGPEGMLHCLTAADGKVSGRSTRQGVPRPPELLRRRQRAGGRGRPADRAGRRQPEGPAADRPAGGQGERHRAGRVRQDDRQGDLPDVRRAGQLLEPGGDDDRRPAARAVLRPRRAGRVRPDRPARWTSTSRGGRRSWRASTPATRSSSATRCSSPSATGPERRS